MSRGRHVFGRMRVCPNTKAAGGSREFTQRVAALSLGSGTNRSAQGEFITVGYSREPLVVAFCERI